jgi:hypothetical protein
MLTQKQEDFCQAIVSGLSQAAAYRQAYSAENMRPAVVQNKASLLMRHGEVGVRIAELRRPIVEKLRYSVEQAMAEADQALCIAREKENAAAMIGAVTLRAKLHGLLVEKREVTVTQVQQLDDASLDALIALKMAEAGLVPEPSVH